MWPALIGAGISAIGSLAGGMISSAGQASQNNASQNFALQNMRENNAFSADQARRQMEFQERMSNTSYQRAMADMKAAGLNPILAYQQGGAGTPQGASGSASQPVGAQFENAMQGLGEGVTSATKGAERFVQLKNVESQTGSNVSQAALNKANENLSTVNAAKAAQETATSAADMRRKDAETALTIEQMDNPKAYRALTAAQGASAYSSARWNDEQTKQLRDSGPGRIGQESSGIIKLINRGLSSLGNSYVKPAGQPSTKPTFFGGQRPKFIWEK